MSRPIAMIVAALTLTGCSAAPVPGDGNSVTGTIHVSAAASLTDSFDLIAAAFEREHPGVDIVVNYGASSTIADQIVQGAPVDVFAAASTTTMQIVVDAGLASRPVTFATNSLQIAVPAGNPGEVAGLADFARPELAIALCAEQVPCGAAAKRALEDAGVVASVDTYEQDVKAVLTKVELGEVDAGLVYVTDVTSAGRAVLGLPVGNAKPIPYPIASIEDAANPSGARAFVEFVLSPDGQAVLEAAGFGAR